MFRREDIIILPINITEDFETCKDFRKDSYHCSFNTDEGFYKDGGESGYKKWLFSKLQAEPFSCVHVWYQNTIVGQIELTIIPKEKIVHVNLFYIRADMRGRGIAHLLNQYAEMLLLNRGYEQLRLCVSPTNLRAIAYYKKMGWIMGEMRNTLPQVMYMHKKIELSDYQKIFYQEAHSFLEKLWQDLPENKKQIGQNIDHLCYRSSDLENYNFLKMNISKFAQLLVESDVNGRPIATYRLNIPIFFQGSTIWEVEIPAPKTGKSYKAGFEHIEIIEPTFEFEEHYTHGLIKYHERSLLTIVNFEKTRHFQALQKSQILSDLKKYSPIVVGTIPLDIAAEDSDVDILVDYENEKEELSIVLKKMQARFQDAIFKQNKDSMSLKFIFEKTQFEIFAQQKRVLKQNGYLHFLVEDRILRLKQSDKLPIKNLKKIGLKTEPAFAQHYGISGDPYSELLKVTSLNEINLRKQFRLSLL